MTAHDTMVTQGEAVTFHGSLHGTGLLLHADAFPDSGTSESSGDERQKDTVIA